MSTLTARETVAQMLSNSPALRAAGLPEMSVYQADTLESPTVLPFFVIRWLDTAEQNGSSSVRPFDMWVYDEPGDFSRAERIGNAAISELAAAEPTKTIDGWISQYVTRGVGLGRGADLFDEGYKAVVIPFRARAVATGS